MISKLSQPDKQPEAASDDAMQLQLEALSAHQVCQLGLRRKSATAHSPLHFCLVLALQC